MIRDLSSGFQTDGVVRDFDTLTDDVAFTIYNRRNQLGRMHLSLKGLNRFLVKLGLHPGALQPFRTTVLSPNERMTLECVGSHGWITLAERSARHGLTLTLPEPIARCSAGVTHSFASLPIKHRPRFQTAAEGALHLCAEGGTRAFHPRDSLGLALRFRWEVALCRRGTDWIAHVANLLLLIRVPLGLSLPRELSLASVALR